MEFNLEKIKEEIEARKSETRLNEEVNGTGRMGAPRDSKKFLVELLTSVNNNGVPTPAVQALRSVTEVTDQRLGAPLTVNDAYKVMKQGGQPVQNTPAQYNQQQPMNEVYQPTPQQLGERDDSYFDRQMQMAVEKLKTNGRTVPQVPNAGLSQTLADYANTQYVGAPSQVNNNLNPTVLNEQVSKSMNEIMGSSQFTKIVSEAYKNMINEMYAKEKVETILVEIIQSDTFKKIMRKEVLNTLKEVQEYQKKKSN